MNETNVERLQKEINGLKEENNAKDELYKLVSSQIEAQSSEYQSTQTDVKTLLSSLNSTSNPTFSSPFSSEFENIHSKYSSLYKKRRSLKSDYKKLHSERNSIMESIKEINQKQLDLKSNAEKIKQSEEAKLSQMKSEFALAEENWKESERILLESLGEKEAEVERLGRLYNESVGGTHKDNIQELDSFLVNLSILSCVISSLYKSLITLTQYKEQISNMLQPILYIYYQLQPPNALRKFKAAINCVRFAFRLKNCAEKSKKDNEWVEQFGQEVGNSRIIRILKWAKIEPVALDELERIVSLGFSNENPLFASNFLIQNFVLAIQPVLSPSLDSHAASLFSFYSHLLSEHQIAYSTQHPSPRTNFALLSVKHDLQTDVISLQKQNEELMRRMKNSGLETNEHLFTLDNEE